MEKPVKLPKKFESFFPCGYFCYVYTSVRVYMVQLLTDEAYMLL